MPCVTDEKSTNCAERISADAFEDLVRDNLAWVRGYFRSRLRDWASADDLAQDVFVTAFMKMGDFREDSPVGIWLRGIARNHLRNFLRKHREEAAGVGEELQVLLDQNSEPWEDDGGDQRLQSLEHCLDRLPEETRKLLKARYVEGFSIREISDKTGKGYSALAMQIHRLRELLLECIQRETLREKT